MPNATVTACGLGTRQPLTARSTAAQGLCYGKRLPAKLARPTRWQAYIGCTPTRRVVALRLFGKICPSSLAGASPVTGRVARWRRPQT